MFNYVDPVGRNFLESPLVAAAFQAKIQGVYEQFARRSQSAFTWLEAFQNLTGGQTPQVPTVDWLAFPLLATANDTAIDQDRFRWQDEYVEWRTERTSGVLTRVTFTTEFPEYFEACAEAGTTFLTQAVHDVIPEANPTVVELFGPGGNPDSLPAVARANRFRNNLRNNPWNNGQQGILCLTQQFNTFGALFNLVTECGVRKPQGSPEDTCALVGGACGPGRSSDPNVCTAAQRAVRNNLAVTLQPTSSARYSKRWTLAKNSRTECKRTSSVCSNNWPATSVQLNWSGCTKFSWNADRPCYSTQCCATLMRPGGGCCYHGQLRGAVPIRP